MSDLCTCFEWMTHNFGADIAQGTKPEKLPPISSEQRLSFSAANFIHFAQYQTDVKVLFWILTSIHLQKEMHHINILTQKKWNDLRNPRVINDNDDDTDENYEDERNDDND